MPAWIPSKVHHIASYPLHLAILLASALGSLADETPVEPPAAQNPAVFADPVSTYRFYIGAVRKTDPVAAKSCFAIGDGSKSGALDVMVGLWISSRRLDQIATRRFGADAARTTLEPFGLSRGDLSDAALDLTEQRLKDAKVKFLGDDKAELVIQWHEDDGDPNEAFEFQGDDPVEFIKVNGAWKIDAIKRIAGISGEEFLKEGTWGAAFRDHVTIADAASDRLTKGTLKSPEDLKAFLSREVSAAEKRYKEAVEERR
jgi:hypothetical protein